MTDVPDPIWRATELRLLGGIAHSLNGVAGALTLGADFMRSDQDEALSGEVASAFHDLLQSLQRDTKLLFLLRDTESNEVMPHDPASLVMTATELFRKLPESRNLRVETGNTSSVEPVEVAAGACVRAIILCLTALVPAVPGGRTAMARLRLEPDDGAVLLIVDGDSLRADAAAPPLAAAARILAGDTGASLIAFDPPTLRMSTAREDEAGPAASP